MVAPVVLSIRGVNVIVIHLIAVAQNRQAQLESDVCIDDNNLLISTDSPRQLAKSSRVCGEFVKDMYGVSSQI